MNQATEFLIEMELCLRQIMIIKSKIRAAMAISICRLVMFSPKT